MSDEIHVHSAEFGPTYVDMIYTRGTDPIPLRITLDVTQGAASPLARVAVTTLEEAVYAATTHPMHIERVREVLPDLERQGHLTPHASQALHSALDIPVGVVDSAHPRP